MLRIPRLFGSTLSPALALLIALALEAPSFAQTYTVHATDPAADYSSLEDALAGVPDHAILLILSDLLGPDTRYLEIDRPVTIVGLDGVGSGIQGRPFLRETTFDISNTEVRFSRLDIEGAQGLILFVDNAAVTVTQCQVWTRPGTEYDCVELAGDSVLTAAESYFVSDGFDGSLYNKTLAISADSVAVLKDCTIESRHPIDAASVHGRMYYANTHFLGNVHAYEGSIVKLLPWTLDLDGEQLRLGGAAYIQGYTGFARALLIYSFTQVDDVLELGTGELLLGTPFFVRPVAGHGSDWALSVSIPDDPLLLGLPLYLQQLPLDQDPQLSCLEVGVIGPAE